MTDTSRILVTGAGGFIGRHSLLPLSELGFEVHAVGRKKNPEISLPAGVNWHRIDLLAPGSATKIIDDIRPTHLLHFAWYAEHGQFWTHPLNVRWVNATLHLIEEFQRLGGIRFVGAGTCAEYDWNSGKCDEIETPIRPTTLYGASKASIFFMGSTLSKVRGFSFAWGRIFHLFGPGEPPGRVVPSFIQAHLLNKELDSGPGDQERDFLPVAALAQAFARLSDSKIEGAVNIGSGTPVSLEELSNKIAQMAGKKGPIRFGRRRESAPTRLIPVLKRLRRELEWRPAISLEAGLEETVSWWKVRLA